MINFKVNFFQTAVVSILQYGCTTWTLTKRTEKTLKLRKNATSYIKKSWKQDFTKQQLYGHPPPISKTIQIRRTRHPEHCWRSKDELINDVLIWTHSHGRTSVGRSTRTYLQQFCTDTGCRLEDPPEVMEDRDEWRERERERERESQGNPCKQCDMMLIDFTLQYLKQFMCANEWIMLKKKINVRSQYLKTFSILGMTLNCIWLWSFSLGV